MQEPVDSKRAPNPLPVGISPLHPTVGDTVVDGLDIPRVTAGMARGDEGQFNLFYGEYFDRIYRYLLVVTAGRDELAREVIQEGMIRILRHIKPFPDAQALCRWLRRVLRSAFIDELRKRKTRITLPLDGQEDPAEQEPESPDEELLAHLQECLTQLPEEDRRLVEGKHLQGQSYFQLAAELAITPKAVESRLGRIRNKLRRLALRRISNEYK